MGYDHQVEIKLAAKDAAGRILRIESWCADWQISFRVLDRFPGSETIRIAFEDPRLARAFIGHFGGVLVDDRELGKPCPATSRTRTPMSGWRVSIQIERPLLSDHARWSVLSGRGAAVAVHEPGHP